MKTTDTSATESCCHSEHHGGGEVRPSQGAAFFCPMCAGVESEQAGDCPKCGMALERNAASKPVIYTCPMHPEIRRDQPGDCPICGMALEPMAVTTEPEGNAELSDMTRRFWIGAALTVPVYLLAMLPMAPMGYASRWMQFALSTPVVFWAGLPFFARGWRSVRTWNLNMFTLIAMGVGAAYLYSAVVMLAPGLFPRLFRVGGGDCCACAAGAGARAPGTRPDGKRDPRVTESRSGHGPPCGGGSGA
jgi:Cu+-exporting ATPase